MKDSKGFFSCKNFRCNSQGSLPETILTVPPVHTPWLVPLDIVLRRFLLFAKDGLCWRGRETEEVKAFKAISAADSFYLSANLVPKAPNKYQILIFWYQAEAEVVDEVVVA